MEKVKLTPELVKGFAGSLLSKRFDNLAATPKFHEEIWDMCCSDHRQVAIAAPRAHAKSTAVTHAYTLASLLFRVKKYVVIVSDTEGQAAQFLYDIKSELVDNEPLIELFGIKEFEKDSSTDIIVVMKDGHKFRITVKGSEQKTRGLIWLGSRPDLFICDDLENDELIANPDRRNKFKKWFFGALLPAGSDFCHIRVIGTILHLDSLLESLLNDDTWVSKRYAAHNEDFSVILWPERFSRERLEQIRRGYFNQGFPEGYSQEYLNWPIDTANAYFSKSDILSASEESKNKPKNYYAAIDFAISQKSTADRTVITVGGIDSDGILYIEYVSAGRWDAKEIVEQMIAVQKRFKPEIFTAERGMIEKAIGPYLRDEMLRRNTFIALNLETPTKDKVARASSIQARMRSGAVKFYKDEPWYTPLEQEMLVFPRGKHDDMVDSLAWLGLTVDKIGNAMTVEEAEEDSIHEEEEEFERENGFFGVSAVCGY